MIRHLGIWCLRAAVAVVLLLAWQLLPTIPGLGAQFRMFDRFFISSPVEVSTKLVNMLTGTHGTVLVWPYLESTISSTLLGSVLGLLLGMLAGLITSSNRLLAEVLGFFLVAANSVPRIALIPIVVLLAGVGFWTSVWATVMVVFFLAYFSSFEGGSRVPKAILESAAVMKASRGRIMFGIRLPYVALWTSAAIPNAISFGLITAVTTELLSGGQGIGQLMLVATANLDSTSTFAVVTLLSLVGLIMLSGTEWLKRKLLAWAVD